MAYQPKQNRNVVSALGEPRAQLVYYGVWLSAMVIGALLLFVIGFLIAGDYKGRTQQTGREAAGPLFAQIETTVDGTKIGYVEKWRTEGEQGKKESAAALARGQANYNRICIGCHYGTQANTSNGPWLGDLYQQTYLYNGQLLNDVQVVKFILLGHGNMPAGIPLPQQAVDVMLYLKQQTCGTLTTDAQKAKCSLP